jgi:hypothetical protein
VRTALSTLLAVGLTATLLSASAAPAGADTQVTAGTTNSAELGKTIPVTRPGKVHKQVVMRLTPEQIPDLRAGDVLKPAAELEVTTQCDIAQRGRPGCSYDPVVHVQLVLAGGPRETSPGEAGAVALSRPKDPTCTIAEHHCLIVFDFDSAERTLGGADDPPCVAQDRCFVNLVAWATHRRARRKDVLILGENHKDFLAGGRSEGDKGRLMLVRRREAAAADDTRASPGGAVAVPTTKQPKRIASFRLGRLHKGERYAVVVDVDGRASNRARLSTKLFLTKNAGADDGNGMRATEPRSISEHNGINCSGSCSVRRVAVFAVEEDVGDPVFLNVEARSGVPSGSASVAATKVTARIIRWDPPAPAAKEPAAAARRPDAGREEPSAVTCRSARLNGWVNPHGSPTRFRFEYWRRGSDERSQAGGGDAGAGDERVDVSRVAEGLEPDTHYSGRLIATNAAGEAASEVFSFTTRPRC